MDIQHSITESNSKHITQIYKNKTRFIHFVGFHIIYNKHHALCGLQKSLSQCCRLEVIRRTDSTLQWFAKVSNWPTSSMSPHSLSSCIQSPKSFFVHGHQSFNCDHSYDLMFP